MKETTQQPSKKGEIDGEEQKAKNKTQNTHSNEIC
jgi:hypothetical protein